MPWVALLLWLVCPVAFADQGSVWLTRGPQGELELHANSPEVLADSTRRLIDWSHLTGAQPNALFPEAVSKYFEINPARDGPNCFGSVLTTLHWNSAHRYVTSQEFLATLAGPMCKKVDDDERSPGDILVFSQLELDSGEVSTLHAAIWVSDLLVWTKNGPDSDMTAVFSPLESLLEIYPVSLPCRQGQRRDCNAWMSTYRCEAALPSWSWGVDTVAEKTLAEIELKLSTRAYDWMNLGFPRFERDPLIDNQLVWARDRLMKLPQDKLSPKQKWGLKLLLLKVQSLDQQNRIVTGIGGK